MKSLLAIAICGLLAFGASLKACDENEQQIKPAQKNVQKSAVPSQVSELTEGEADFLANGPRLYSMDKALALSKETGKPVVCWIGKHIFADEKARTVSAELGKTTIQAVMDDDGISIDRDGKRIPANRVKFSSNNYTGNSQTAYIPVSKLGAKSGSKILQFIRGNVGE